MKIDYSKFKNKIKFWKKIVSVKDFFGSSPPSIFVGRYGYPKVYVGLLSPTFVSNAKILDYPEEWYRQKATIEQIIDYRAQLVYSRFKTRVTKNDKIVEKLQEIIPAKKEVDVEVSLKKKPVLRFAFGYMPPIANPAPLAKLKIVQNPKIERKLDYIISDTDLKAKDAVIALYKSGIEISRIQKIFSAGLFGLKIERKLVPTRWSITAVDSIIADYLLEKVKHFDLVSNYQLFFNEYLANRFYILLIPRYYEYELIEFWDVDKKIGISKDYEPYFGRKEYAHATAGAFYAAKLAVLEYMLKIKKQASVLIIREVLPDYYAPVGVWKIREAVRDAFSSKPILFDSLEQALSYLSQKLITKGLFAKHSKILQIIRQQQKLQKFTTFISK